MKKIPCYILISFLVLEIVVISILRNSAFFVEECYIPFYQSFTRLYSQICSYFPFSLGDLLYIVLFIYIFSLIYKIIQGLFQKKYDILKKSIKSILLLIIAGIFIFNIFWSFLYGKKSLAELFPARDITITELKSLSEDYRKECIIIREKLPMTIEIEEDKVIKSIQQSQDNLPKDLPFHQSLPKASVKKSLFSVGLSYSGIGGYYNPFTTEAQINNCIPTHKKPFVMAHEMAHQLGYATENEANFVGFLSCVNSKNLYNQYAGKLVALKYLLREISKKDSLFVKNQLNLFSIKMKHDRQIEHNYHDKYEGNWETLFTFFNDYYLKMNKQEGIESYQRFTQLLVGYHRKK